MKKHLLLLLLAFGSAVLVLPAQNCRSIFEQAQGALARKQFETALRKLQDTEICDIRNEMLRERQALYSRIFEAVSALRTKAEQDADSLKAGAERLRASGESLQKALDETGRAKQLAEDALAESKRTETRAVDAEKVALTAGRRSDSLLTVANNILGSLYFYENRFALAFDGLRYGFMDRSGKPVIPFQYNTAVPFDPETGLARVGRNYQQFLLDTAGREHLLALSLVPFNASVEAAYLSSQAIDNLPGWFYDAKPLRYIALDNNRLFFVGDRIGELTNLQQLDLSKNLLGKIPAALTVSGALTRLDLAGNRLRELPGVWRLPALTSLNLGYNRLREFAPEEFEAPNLRELNLSHNRLTAVPPVVETCTRLDVLDLSGNELATFPLQAGRVPDLRVLHLSLNRLSAVPAALGDMSRLQELHLAFNQIAVLPPELGNLNQLELLDLSHNQLDTLPDFFQKMTGLRVLNLAGNRLRELPDWLGRLPRLEKVYKAGNPVRSVPEALKDKVE